MEPWLDPNNVVDLWYFDGPPDSTEKRDRIFQAGPHRLMFGGHYHLWLLVNPQGLCDWQGDVPVSLSEGRYFTVIGALCEGRSAVLDTETSLLTPFNL